MRKQSHNTRRAAAILLLLACASARGQQAYKLSEAERPRCDLSEVWPLNDLGSGALAEIARRPDAQTAVVVYGLPGASIVYARDVKRWLSEVRGVAPGRVLDVYGGPAHEMRMELWLVPAGAAPPRAARRRRTGHAVRQV
jgi:hypothetical protein